MRIIKPKALKRGDVIGIAAPASPPASEEKLSRGIRYLEQLGYRIKLGRNVHRKRGYLAGTDQQRASDLHELFADKNIKAIFSARGGYGATRILPLLDYNLIRRNPKILVGYSDITALHLALFTRSGLTSFSGPMAAVEMADGLNGNAEEVFWRNVTSAKPIGTIQSKKNERFIGKQTGRSTGRLLGGNLSLLSVLVGTPYIPTTGNLIVLIEEIDERPYRIDRMLQHLKLSNMFRKSNGVVLGSFAGCQAEKGKPSLSLQQVLADTFQEYSRPIVAGIHFGHVKNSLSLPVGVRVRLNGVRGTLEFLEAGVS